MKTAVAVSTISWIRTPEESDTVISSMKSLSRLRVPVVVVDAGSPYKEQQIIKSLPHILFFENTNGLTSQLLQSHEEAAKRADHLFYLQSDKPDFTQKYASKLLEKYLSLPERSLLIPARTRECLDTYPAYQRETENFLNFFLSDFIGSDQDYFAGPKLFPSYLTKYLTSFKLDVGWGIESFIYALAKRLNLAFNYFPVYFRAPKDPPEEKNIKEYRLKIVAWQIEALLYGSGVPLNKTSG